MQDVLAKLISHDSQFVIELIDNFGGIVSLFFLLAISFILIQRRGEIFRNEKK